MIMVHSTDVKLFFQLDLISIFVFSTVLFTSKYVWGNKITMRQLYTIESLSSWIV